jgi:nucleoside transporter
MAEPLSYTTPEQPAGLDMGLRIRLSIMMFLQYAIWGAWWVVLVKYLIEIGFTGANVGAVYGTMAIASIFSPLVFGQIADRWVPTQYLLTGLHLAGAVLLYLVTQYTDFGTFYILVLLYALLYIPTISLTNSLSFHNIPDAGKYFPGIRVFGTIGWIAAGLFVGAALLDNTAQPILLACVLSAVMGVFCLALPHTPPTGKAGDALPFVKAVGLLKDGQFAFFIAISFVISIILAGYYAFTAQFLTDIGVGRVAAVMTIGQFSEMLLLPFLPFFLRYLGMKWTLVLGMAAWGIRYGVFSVGEPMGLVIASLVLHGLCYDFFFVAAYIHVDNQASVKIRASAQALFNLVVMGLGMWIGNIVFGRLVDAARVGDVVNWQSVWFYPTIVVAIALPIFIIGFRDKPKVEEAPEAGFPVEVETDSQG